MHSCASECAVECSTGDLHCGEMQGTNRMESVVESKNVFLFDVWLTVHRNSVWIRKTN